MVKSSKKQLTSKMSSENEKALREIADKITELRRIQSITQKELAKKNRD